MKTFSVAIYVLCALFPGITFAEGNAGAATFKLDDIGRVLALFLVFTVMFETAMTPILTRDKSPLASMLMEGCFFSIIAH